MSNPNAQSGDPGQAELEDDDDRDDDDASDEKPAARAPARPRRAARRSPARRKPTTARARTGSTVGRRPKATKTAAPAEDEDEAGDDKADPLGALPEDPTPPPLENAGPSPLESAERSGTLEVERREANGPANGFDDGSDWVGPCGTVGHEWGFQRKISQKWGGGEYDCTGVVKGKVITKRVSIGGPSKIVAHAEESVPQQPAPQQPSPFVGGPFGGGFPRPPFFGDPRTPFSGTPFGTPFGSPFGFPGGPPLTPFQQQAAAYQNLTGAGRSPQAEEEARLLREELEAVKERERQAREDARVAAIRLEEERKDVERQRQFDAAITRVGGGGEGNREWLQMQQQRMEQDRLDREQRRIDEDNARKLERQKEEDRRRDQEAKDRQERIDRLDREERERRDRREHEEKLARERGEEQKRQEAHQDRIMTMMTTNQMKPADTIKMISELRTASGGGAASQIKDLTEGMLAIKKLTRDDSDDAPETKLDQAGRFVERLGAAFAPAIREGAQWWEKAADRKAKTAPPPGTGLPIPAWAPPGTTRVLYGNVPQPTLMQDGTLLLPPPQQQQPGVVQPQGLPGPQGGAPAPGGVSPAGQAQSNQVEAEAARTGVTPQQWGKILEFVVDSAAGNAAPKETAEHLMTLLRAIDALPALEALSSSRVVELKGRVNLLLLTGKVTDAKHRERMESFCALAEHEVGGKWLENLLKWVKHYFEQIRAMQSSPATAPSQGPSGEAPVGEVVEGEDEGDDGEYEDEGDAGEGPEGDFEEPPPPSTS